MKQECRVIWRLNSNLRLQLIQSGKLLTSYSLVIKMLIKVEQLETCWINWHLKITTLSVFTWVVLVICFHEWIYLHFISIDDLLSPTDLSQLDFKFILILTLLSSIIQKHKHWLHEPSVQVPKLQKSFNIQLSFK